MTKIQISLHDGNVITAEVASYNSADLANKLNDPKLLMVQVGDAIINKNAVKLIIPVPAQ
jgi:hypothetical protein